jgi:hypothetical protein
VSFAENGQKFYSSRAGTRTFTPRCYDLPVRLLIEIRKSNGAFETLGRFSATPEELGELHIIVAQHAIPLDAIDCLPAGLLRDTFLSCQENGFEVRVTLEGAN